MKVIGRGIAVLAMGWWLGGCAKQTEVVTEGLTAEESRNLEALKAWQAAWSTIGQATHMVDDLYADSCEVYTPLNNLYYARQGQSKELWRNLEIAFEDATASRDMEVSNVIARGPNVALEAAVTLTPKNGGATVAGWFSAHLTFQDGRVVTDHTYLSAPSSDFVTPALGDAYAKIVAAQ